MGGGDLDGGAEREGRDADGGAGVAALVAEGEHHEVGAAVDDLGEGCAGTRWRGEASRFASTRFVKAKFHFQIQVVY